MKIDALAEAMDFDPSDIQPCQELEDSNFALGDSRLLNEIYEEQGYLLFRDLLDRGSVDRALKRMMAVMARYAVVAVGAKEPVWAGRPSPFGMEESVEFKGICKELVEHPANLKAFEKILGEPPASVPIVQYRSYAPGSPVFPVHQDGFFAPGIHGYRPVWMPLMKIDATIGSLMLALGMHKKGVIHNLAKPPAFPIPAGAIPEECWATTTYYPGDVLVIHPLIPHVGMPNRSNMVRFSIDSRVQSAARPCVMLGDVVATTPNAFTLRTEQGDREIALTGETYIRTGESRGARIPLERYQAETPIGLRVVVSIEGDNQATMVRRASEG